nr:hypothetical protein [Stackebrandtia albiflava]
MTIRWYASQRSRRRHSRTGGASSPYTSAIRLSNGRSAKVPGIRPAACRSAATSATRRPSTAMSGSVTWSGTTSRNTR